MYLRELSDIQDLGLNDPSGNGVVQIHSVPSTIDVLSMLQGECGRLVETSLGLKERCQL